MEHSAEALKRLAEKKIKVGFFSILRSNHAYDEAASLYTQASNKYKLQQQWNQAAECCSLAADMHEKNSDLGQAANMYIEAANCLNKLSSNDSMKYTLLAIEIYKKCGRFSQAAKQTKSLAEVCEDRGKFRDAMIYYRDAASLYDMDEYGKSSYSTCIVKFAQYAAKLNKSYKRAIEIFELEAKKCLKIQLINFGAREHFLNAGILYLVMGDDVEATLAFESYDRLDNRFAISREGVLLRSLIDAFHRNDISSFLEAIEEYEKVPRLCNWKLHFLSKVQDEINSRCGNSKPAVTMDGSIDLS